MGKTCDIRNARIAVEFDYLKCTYTIYTSADGKIWANANGVITGYTDSGMFGAANKITREQMAAILYRYAKAEGYNVEVSEDLDDFPDADKVSGFAQDAMKWAVATGIIKGDKGKVNPQGNANRAEAATVIKRFCEAYEK